MINAITRWGSTQVQSMYLPVFAEDTDVTATFAFQEATPAFNPYQLKTIATETTSHLVITGEKTLVVLGDTADVFLVSAEFNGQPDIFVVQSNESIAIKANPAMG